MNLLDRDGVRLLVYEYITSVYVTCCMELQICYSSVLVGAGCYPKKERNKYVRKTCNIFDVWACVLISHIKYAL